MARNGKSIRDLQEQMFRINRNASPGQKGRLKTAQSIYNRYTNSINDASRTNKDVDDYISLTSNNHLNTQLNRLSVEQRNRMADAAMERMETRKYSMTKGAIATRARRAQGLSAG